MPPIGLFFFFLGLVVAPDTLAETTTGNGLFIASNNLSSYSTTVTPLDASANVTRSTSYSSVTVMNTTEGNSTILPSTTTQNGGGISKSGTSPKPIDLSKTTTSLTKTTKNLKDKKTTVKAAKWTGDDSTGIIILVVIILVALGFGVACLYIRNRRRRNSVNFSSRPDEANIPLSTVEPIDAVPQNGLQTFESTETTKEPEEPEAKIAVQEEQKAEAGKSAVDPSAESAAPVPTPDSSEDKPKEDIVEQSPPAPVEPSVEEKTDDEGVVSNETSVESLKETNENNSNNAAFSQTRDTKRSINFWDVPLDCPV